MTPRSAAEVEALGRLCTPVRGQLALKEFSVMEIADAGTGDRVCVDTCSNFFRDEGLLVGAFGGGFLLCCSETHPLPYMPTRPFRVNAGAVSSYILSSPERTNYLSELRQGHTVTAVRVNGDTRPVVVGRAKIETRPLLLIKARSADGDEASLMLQYGLALPREGQESNDSSELEKGLGENRLTEFQGVSEWPPKPQRSQARPA
jgi:3-amino-4-hydroxybenzoic acid synthase